MKVVEETKDVRLALDDEGAEYKGKAMMGDGDGSWILFMEVESEDASLEEEAA